MTNLRQRYRDYLGRLEGAGSPRDTIEQGLQVPSPMDALRHDLARRAELRPEQANYLLLGNIGTGKTLQLMLIEEHLKQSQDIRALYLDVDPKDQASLAESVARLLLQRAPSWALQAGVQKFLSGVESQFTRATGTISSTSKGALLEMASVWKKEQITPVLLVDGLDRLDVRTFHVMSDNLLALRDVGLGTIVVGPPWLQYDDQPGLKGQFERVYIQPVLDPSDPQQADFLFRVLRQRASAEILSDEACKQCVAWSGGLMRDLLLLAQQAGEEAYVNGAGAIEEPHVTSAAHHLGERMKRTLTPSTRNQIREVEDAVSQPNQVYTGEADRLWASLLSENLLLRYDSHPSTRYEFHPCLRLHLDHKAAAQ